MSLGLVASSVSQEDCWLRRDWCTSVTMTTPSICKRFTPIQGETNRFRVILQPRRILKLTSSCALTVLIASATSACQSIFHYKMWSFTAHFRRCRPIQHASTDCNKPSIFKMRLERWTTLISLFSPFWASPAITSAARGYFW